MSTPSLGSKTVTMRELSRNTKAVIEQVVRSGRPAVITFHGRPQVAVAPLVGAVEIAEPYVLRDAPAHIQQVIRAAEADVIGGRASVVDDSVFEGLGEEAKPTFEETLAALQEKLGRLEDVIRSASGMPDAVDVVREALREAHVLAIGRPAEETSVPEQGTESNIVTYTTEPEGSSVMMPVFTNAEVLRSALFNNSEWQSYTILELSGRELAENVDPDVTIVVDPGSELEFHIPPAETRKLVAEQPIAAAAELV